MPGYSERTRRVEFPELGDDIWVEIRNPLLLPLEPDAWDKLSVPDRRWARYSRWIKAWNVYAVDENGDPTDEPLGPASAETLPKAPIDVLNRVYAEVADWSNPLGTQNGSSTTGSTSSKSSSNGTPESSMTPATSPTSTTTSG